MKRSVPAANDRLQAAAQVLCRFAEKLTANQKKKQKKS
jgi:hypothetical protein